MTNTRTTGKDQQPYKTSDPDKVRRMFSTLSATYDRGNRVLSLGLDGRWRRLLVDGCNLKPGGSAFDFCCGTGDVTFELERRVGEMGRVTGLDFAPPMLELAKDRAKKQGSIAKFIEGDALTTQAENDSYDASTIAFGIRNLADTKQGIMEMARVVRPGGVVGILETGQPPNPIMAGLYRFYNHRIIPLVGGWISGDRSAYQYLHDTSSRFPHGSELVEIMESTGCFSRVKCRPVTFGVAWLYWGEVA